MKADCLVENIEKHIPLLSRTIPTHSQIPVFSNIFVEAKKEGFFLSATDLDMGARIKIPAKIEEEGAITVPGKQFAEIISSLPKDKVGFVTEKDSFCVLSRENKMSLQTIPAEEFPKLFEEKNGKKISFKKENFKNIFSKLVFAVSQDETRPSLMGVLLDQKDGENYFVGTDGYRLSFVRTNASGIEVGEKIILSARLINEILLLKEGAGEIVLVLLKEANQVLVESGETTLVGRLIEGDFPNYERVIPSSFKTKITLDKEQFLQSLRLSSVFARESANIVKFQIKKDLLEVFSQASGVGQGDLKIEAQKEGEDNEIAFNVKFVLDFLRNTESKEISFEMSSPLDPGVFREEGREDYLHVIMPVRVQE